MKFENTGLEKLKADLNRLDDVMLDYGLVREGQWDYEWLHMTESFELREGTFYLRVQGHAIEGNVDLDKAVIELMTPLLGKHYYPHGVEYGEGENFPSSLVNQCKKILESIKPEVDKFSI